MSTADPNDPRDPLRDPLGLAADAPLLAAWLDWMRLAQAGQVAPMTTPGHKQRYDLVGTVVAGDAPLYGALAPIKYADRLRRSPGRPSRPGERSPRAIRPCGGAGGPGRSR